jgi:hypothetical protein
MAWPEDLTKITAEELAALHQENEAWGKDLRIRIKGLMDGKVAGDIGKDEYATNRKIANKGMNEYRRRGRLLVHELSERTKRTFRAGASGSL